MRLPFMLDMYLYLGRTQLA